jgi:hypothetical protein
MARTAQFGHEAKVLSNAPSLALRYVSRFGAAYGGTVLLVMGRCRRSRRRRPFVHLMAAGTPISGGLGSEACALDRHQKGR